MVKMFEWWIEEMKTSWPSCSGKLCREKLLTSGSIIVLENGSKLFILTLWVGLVSVWYQKLNIIIALLLE